MPDVVTLSRIQFATTIMFHYLFPPLTIGMGVILVYLEARYLWTREIIYETASRFWTQLFAITFAMGVATGIVMEFEFGTNWSVYSRSSATCSVRPWPPRESSLFFLESGFLAVLVYGWDKVESHFPTSSQPSWSRWGQCSRRFGSSWPTAGSRLPPGIRRLCGHIHNGEPSV